MGGHDSTRLSGPDLFERQARLRRRQICRRKRLGEIYQAQPEVTVHHPVSYEAPGHQNPSDSREFFVFLFSIPGPDDLLFRHHSFVILTSRLQWSSRSRESSVQWNH